MIQTTVSAVLEAVRDAHPAFNPYAGPTTPIIRYLGRYVARLAAMIADARPAAVVQTFTIDPATHDFDAGQALPSSSDEPPAKDVLRVTGGEIFNTEGCSLGNLEIVSFPQRIERLRYRAALVDQGKIRLLGGSDAWKGISSVTVRYFPEPTLPATPADVVDLPGAPLDALAAACADFLATRGGDAVTAADRTKLNADWREAEARYLDDVGQRRVVSAAQVREVW